MKTLKRLSQFRPQKANANKGNPRGLTQLDKSLRRDGYSAPMVAAADGEVFAGSKRLERAADVFGADIEPIVVHSDGTRPVIHVRDDIKTADDPRAVRLGVADNAIAHMDYDPDGELLALLAAEDAAIAEMVKADKASLDASLLANSALSWAEGFEKVPDEDRAPFQQMTFTLHDSQVEQVKRAISLAIKIQDFSGSQNENSNGNGLSFVCETFIASHDNR